MLRVENLRAGYGKTEILHGISFSVAAGECVVLIGVNGAGKTTVLRAICGLVPVTAGKVWLADARIDGCKGHNIARRGLVMCPEGRQVFPEMSVIENLELGAYRRSDDRAAIRRDLEEVLTLFPVLSTRAKQDGGTLSGGEQEMLAIGRAMMARPQVFIFDEPSLGLAPKVVAEVGLAIARIKARGTTILLVEQNADMALRLADRGYVLETGEIRLEGTGAELRSHPDVASAYLGY